MFSELIFPILSDLVVKVIRSRSHDVGTTLFKRVLVLFDSFQISLSLLVVVVVTTHAHLLLFKFTLGLQAAPVTLNYYHSMLALFLHHVVYILCIEVLNEVILSAH